MTRLGGWNEVKGRPGWHYGLGVRAGAELTVTAHGPAGQEVEIVGDGWTGPHGVHAKTEAAIAALEKGETMEQEAKTTAELVEEIEHVEAEIRRLSRRELEHATPEALVELRSALASAQETAQTLEAEISERLR